MSDIVIQVEGVGKCFPKGRQNGSHKGSDEIWAIKDVSFEVKQGEKVGIIGSNGAGKSTLLKVLSRIMEPTRGRFLIKGRVASLIGVGTGFHQEFTGRENIYLNGAILGMSIQEINRKFDEIVAFSETEQLLDTQVKHYSSGMYMRLAFAVAAYLDAEILIIDEVLAVGDHVFQNKCLGKIDEAAKKGRTVLFVTHSMAMVENLCNRALWMDHGRLNVYSDTRSAIDAYLDLSAAASLKRKLTSEVMDVELDMVNEDHVRTCQTKCGFPVAFHLRLDPKRDLSQIDFALVIYNAWGQELLTLDSRWQSKDRFTIHGECDCVVKWDKNILSPGEYVLGIKVFEMDKLLMKWPNALRINVSESDYYATGKLPKAHQSHILTDASWLIANH